MADINADAYFMRRLATTRQTQELTPSMQFDLARMDITDDELEEVLAEFGREERPRWGFSEVFNELLSTQPKSVAVNDIKALQNNLKIQGYAPPDVEADGTWTPEWNGYFRRHDEDQFSEQIAGKHWLATTTQRAAGVLAWTIPSNIFKGIVGTAKGFVEQAPETAERLGAAGGAVAGAGIGTIIAPGIGTAVGAGIGAGIGFIADLFGSDEGEEGQSAGGAFLDALSPWEEYAVDKKGVRNFFEDLGWVGTAASLVSGAQLGVTGVKGGLAAMKAATPAAVASGAKNPGLMAAMTRAPLAEPTFFGKVTGAAMKPVFGSNQVSRWLEFTRTKGLMAVTNTPAINTIRGGYTGMATAQFGARMFGGIGSGKSETTIEKAIREAPDLPSMVDWADFVIYPQKFLPFSASKMLGGANKLLGDASLWPLVHVVQSTEDIGHTAAKAKVNALLGDNPADRVANLTQLQLDYGIHRKTLQMMDESGYRQQSVGALGAKKAYRAQVIRDLKAEAQTDSSDLATELMSWHRRDPEDPTKGPGGFAAWLLELGTAGRGLDRMKNHLEASRLASKTKAQLLSGELTLAGKIGSGISGGKRRVELKLEIERLEKQYEEILDRAGSKERDPMIVVGLPPRAEALLDQAMKLKEELKAITKAKRREIKDVEIVAERYKVEEIRSPFTDEVLATVNDTPSDTELSGLAKTYDKLKKRVDATAQAKNDQALNVAMGNLGVFVDELALREIIPRSMAEKVKVGSPGKAVSAHLKRAAKVAAHEAALPPEVMDQFHRLGFRPAITGEDVLFPDELHKLVEVEGLGDYTRRQHVWRTLGLGLDTDSDKTLFALRNAHEEAEAHQFLTERGLRMTGNQAMARIYTALRARNHDAVLTNENVLKRLGSVNLTEVEKGIDQASVRGPFVITSQGKRMYAIDVRQLTVDDISEAFKDIPEWTDADSLGMVGALKRGSAYGGEFKIGHPLETARALGRSMRVNGLPGFSDLMRTWHTKNQKTLDVAAASKGGELKYVASGALVKSPHRKALHKGIRKFAVEAKLPVERERTLGVVFDMIAESNVKAGKASSVNEFFKNVDVATVRAMHEKYAQEIANLAATPNLRTLNALLAKDDIAKLLGGEDAVKELRTIAANLPPGGRKAKVSLAAKRTAVGAAAGGAVGFAEGDDKLDDTITGILLGAGFGAGMNHMTKLSYGYLPDYLTRMNAALRYTLSFTFDLGRYSEQNLIAAAKYGLPGVVRPKRYLKARQWATPYASEKVSGDTAVEHAARFWDEINGTTWFQSIDDMDRRAYQAGLLGFQPREFEAAQALMLYQRGWSKDKIRKAVSEIGRYGLGRTAAEKTANFIFFPFSFQKKLLLSMGEFVLQAPGRNLLIHEGLRRYHESTLNEGVQDFLDKHLPFLETLAKVNNLSYGFSPGRFFLEGTKDHRTMRGQAAQILASVFVPSGAATPLAQAAGGLGDLSLHAFSPVVLTGDSINEAGGVDGLDDIFRRYVPFIRDLNRWWESGSEQVTASTEGAAPWYQYQAYNDALRERKRELDPLAMSLGYADADGLMSGTYGGAVKESFSNYRMELFDKYPTGAKMSQEFESSTLVDQKALIELAEDPDKSPAEEAILTLVEKREEYLGVAEMLGVSQSAILSVAAKSIRETAMKHADDRQFVELWDRFFEYQFGPIVRTV